MGEGKALYGVVPTFFPCILEAELYAVRLALRFDDSSLSALVIDNSVVVRGLLNGRKWCTSASRAHADTWREIWATLEDLGKTPCEDHRENGIRIYKAKSHLSKKEKEKQTPEELARTVLNEDADEYAKKGAELVASREWHRAYRQEGKTLSKRICEYIASFRVALAGV